MIAGNASPRFGEAKNSWLTGTSAWTFLSISQAILGIVPDYEGLRLCPCLPTWMDGYKAKRVFRGTELDITVKRAADKDKGLWVDGVKVKGNTVPVTDAKKAEVLLLV